jgi:predicted nucleic acid-binding Zn ribbon protein
MSSAGARSLGSSGCARITGGGSRTIRTDLLELIERRQRNLGTGQGYILLTRSRQFEEASGKRVPCEVASRWAADVTSCYANPATTERLAGAPNMASRRCAETTHAGRRKMPTALRKQPCCSVAWPTTSASRAPGSESPCSATCRLVNRYQRRSRAHSPTFMRFCNLIATLLLLSGDGGSVSSNRTNIRKCASSLSRENIERSAPMPS